MTHVTKWQMEWQIDHPTRNRDSRNFAKSL